MPNSLFKIDFSSLPSELQIRRATLHLYTLHNYRPEFSQAIQLYAVDDDSWASDKTATDEIYQWPTVEVIDSFNSGQTGWRQFDITGLLQDALHQGHRSLSFKLGIEPKIAPSGWDIFASPSWDKSGQLSSLDNSNLRPYIKIVYSDTTLMPDFQIGSSDIQLIPRFARPGEPALLQAKIHNFGGQAAAPVHVRFLDIFNLPIGSDQLTAALPAAKGIDSVSVPWNITEGAHYVRVQVDPENQVDEMREDNNTILKKIEILNDYENYHFDFEGPEFAWAPDFDGPLDPEALGDQPVDWLILPQDGNAHSGSKSILMYLDGKRDDGAIWIEKAFPVEPYTDIRVKIDFFIRDPFVGIQGWAIVAFADTFNPEAEVIFENCNIMASENLWKQCAFTRELFTGEFTEIWVAIGIWARWEVAATFYLDDISITINRGDGTAIKGGINSNLPKNWRLAQNYPNPFTNQTRITGSLPDGNEISLRIWNILGQEVKRFEIKHNTPEPIEVFWNGTNEKGEKLPGGIYFYSLWYGSKMVQARKMLKVY